LTAFGCLDQNTGTLGQMQPACGPQARNARKHVVRTFRSLNRDKRACRPRPQLGRYRRGP
jgi:hypothetical protein